MYVPTKRNITRIFGVLGALVAVILLAFLISNYRLYIIHTGSMERTIPSGSVVLVQRGPALIGEVISFSHGGEVVTHRLIGINHDGTLVTKGDSNATPDAMPTAPDQVIGHVIYAPQRVGYWLYYLKGITGFRSAIFLALAVVFTFLAIRSGKNQAPPESKHLVV
jgi:signal peptidase